MSFSLRKARVCWALLAWLAFPAFATAADHMDSPRVKMFGYLDLNDIYLFKSTNHPENTVLIATVVPMAGLVNQPIFSPYGDYEFKIDNTGDAIEDITYRFSFSFPNRRGIQRMVVQEFRGNTSRVLTVGLTGPKPLALKGGGYVEASYFDDPFFFDENAYLRFRATGNPNSFTNPGVNFFANFNTMAIVMEVPSSTLVQHPPGADFDADDPPLPIGFWARTMLNGAQFDREGRPAINTVLIPASLKDQFNSTEPVHDRFLYMDTVAGMIASFKNDPMTVMNLTQFLLPDVNTFDTRSTRGFPNGRKLTDDVIDAEYQLLLRNLGVTTDYLGNDSTFRVHFPYLGVPNRYPKGGK